MPDYHAIWLRDYGFVVHCSHWPERWRRRVCRWHLGWAIGLGWFWVAEAARVESNTTDWVVWKRK